MDEHLADVIWVENPPTWWALKYKTGTVKTPHLQIIDC
jgi:hypothetical protein